MIFRPYLFLQSFIVMSLFSLTLTSCVSPGLKIAKERGCVQTEYLSIVKLPLNKQRLASHFSRAPDPLKEGPYEGERLYVSWDFPFSIEPKNKGLQLRLSLIFKNLTEESYLYPVNQRAGIISYTLLNETFHEKQGFLAYKAELLTHDGTVIDSWQHQLWVRLIK